MAILITAIEARALSSPDSDIDRHIANIIAITIGPIGDTMALMDKPGALWLSSYMFSFEHYLTSYKKLEYFFVLHLFDNQILYSLLLVLLYPLDDEEYFLFLLL